MTFQHPPFLIRGYPIPPSDNALKTPVRRFKKGVARDLNRRVLSFSDSHAYLEFKSAVNIWRMKNFNQYSDDFAKLIAFTRAGRPIGIQMDLRVHHSRLFTADGKVRKWDVTNYVKAVHDTFSAILGFDDSLFFECAQRKVEIPETRSECIYLRIGPIERSKELT